MISLKNTLQNQDLRKKIVEASNSITDKKSFEGWLKQNFSLEQVSIENSDENILFCVFVTSLRKIVGKKILPCKIDTIELYKSLLNGRFIPKTLYSSPFKMNALDTIFIEYRDSLWKSYFNTPDFFTKYPSYYFWFKYAKEATYLHKSHLKDVWGMIPDAFRSDGRNDDKWSRIDLPFKEADKLYTAFEEVKNSWNGNDEEKDEFFAQYPSYYFWLRDAEEAKDLNKSNLGHVWGMIPVEFREQWSKINLPFNDADNLYTAFDEVKKSWNGNKDVKAQFFVKYPSYYFWLKDVAEAQDLNKSNLGSVWGMIPVEFREQWSKIDLPFNDADKLYTAFDEVKKSWNGNKDVKAQFFEKYPSYYIWCKNAKEAQNLNKSHLGHVWGMIPDAFREQWSYIGLPFKDADNLHNAFKKVQKKLTGNADAKAQFFEKYPSYYLWLKDVAEAQDLNKSHLGSVWGMIPDEFREKWSYINLSFEDADKLYNAFEDVQKSWGGNPDTKTDFFTKYPSYYFWFKYAKEATYLHKSHLKDVWGMIPDEFRKQWSWINLPFEDADKLYTAFEKVQKSWNGNPDAKTDFFRKYPSYYIWFKKAPEAKGLNESNLAQVWGMIPNQFRKQWSKIKLSFEDADKLHNAFEEVRNSWNGKREAKAQFFVKYPSYYFWLRDAEEAQGLKDINLGQVWGMIPNQFRKQWSWINLSFKEADKLHSEILEDSKTWGGDDQKVYMQHFAETNLKFGSYWGLIPTSLRQKFNLEYYHPGKIVYKGIKVDSKEEFAVLRVFEEVLDYKPEVGSNFQVEVDSNSRHTFDFKIEYQENGVCVTHFFEWHPVVVSFNGGRNDACGLDEYPDIVDLVDEASDIDWNSHAEELTGEVYGDQRLELLTNKTSNTFRGDVRLTCATAGNRTGGLRKNLATLHEFLQQAKPDLELTLAQLTTMFQGFLKEAKGYEVESVESAN